MDLNNILFTASVWVVPILLAVTLHEAAHGWTAWRLGDDTAHALGRVTFNPIKHMDPFGTVLLPAMLLYASGGKIMFGFAKPVPVDFGKLRKPRRDMALVAVAGPAVNLALATLSATLFHALPFLSGDLQQWVGHNLFNSVWINLLLCVFNLLPLPPLDGGRIAVALLPRALGMPLARLERAGFFIIIGAIFLVPWVGGKFGLDLNVFWWLIGAPAEFLSTALFSLLGIK